MDNWHVGAICEHLEAVTSGQIRRLLINVPFRTAKSTVVSVMWPAWMWINRPSYKWLTGSYAHSLAIRDNLAMRRLIQSSWYRERWGRGFNLVDNSDWGDPEGFELTKDQNAKIRFDNDRTGYRLAFSFEGGVMGEGGDTIIVDDPHDRNKAHSDIELANGITTFREAISTRLNEPAKSSIVIIMQRLRENDLSGYVISQGDYQHLLIPMHYDPSRSTVVVTGWKDPRTVAGELMHSERFPDEIVKEIEKTLGPYAAAGQLEQRPAPSEGGILKREWWKYYDELPVKFEEEIQSWDLGGRIIDTGSETANFTCGQAWGRLGANCYLKPEQVYAQLDFVREVDAITDFASRHSGSILIEKAANGIPVAATLKDKIPGIILISPEGDKTERARAITPYLAAGNVWLPNPNDRHGNPIPARAWVNLLVDNAATFPNGSQPVGSHGDDVDALTQAVHKLLHGISSASTAIKFLRLRVAKMFDDEHEERHQRMRTECSGEDCGIITEIMTERGFTK